MPRKKASATNKHLLEFISETSGKNGVKIIGSIGEGTTDEKIEKKTKLKMAEIRTALNQLHNHGIVEYTREKNLSNGWFTYTWKLNMDRAMKNFLGAKKKQYQELRQQMSSEEAAMFYKCRKSCIRLGFDEALEAKFKCPTCNTKMNFTDNKDELKTLDNKISTLEKIIDQERQFSP